MVTVFHDMKTCNKHIISLSKTNSSGFDAEVLEDTVIADDSGQQRTIGGGTEKSKHKAKKYTFDYFYYETEFLQT